MAGKCELTGPYPGVLGEVVGWHGRYYNDAWGLDRSFEAEVAGELGEFMLRYDEARDVFVVARDGGTYAGSVVLDGSGESARLRWFFVPPTMRGRGVGQALMEWVMTQVRSRGIASVYLWTFQGLDAARALYLRTGFTVREEVLMHRWGREGLMQRYGLDLTY